MSAMVYEESSDAPMGMRKTTTGIPHVVSDSMLSELGGIVDASV